MSTRPFENLIPRIAGSAYIDPAALVIGDVEIGADSSVWPLTVIRGDINSIKIGAYTNIQDGSILHVSHDSEYAPGGFGLRLGNRITVGHHVVLHGCEIEDMCLIGMGSIVLDGARIERGAMLAAGSLVAPGKVLEGGFLWRGSPVRRARELTSQECDYLDYSADYYVQLARRHARRV
jgi:carbonic anhydrase/acetyltransferase-like protein (isoleucine patch superfamily)